LADTDAAHRGPIPEGVGLAAQGIARLGETVAGRRDSMWALTSFARGNEVLLIVFWGGGGKSQPTGMSRILVGPTEIPNFSSSPKMPL
jgi:hypothetical protein